MNHELCMRILKARSKFIDPDDIFPLPASLLHDGERGPMQLLRNSQTADRLIEKNIRTMKLNANCTPFVAPLMTKWGLTKLKNRWLRV